MHRGPESELSRYLEPDERILWTGTPRQGLVLRGADAFLIPFGLLWGGFAIFWEDMAIRQGAGLFFELWGIPMVLIGLHMIVGRFFTDARVRARTVYGLTQERVIIVSGLFSRSVTSLPLATLSDISLSERSDRSGTIHFGRPPAFAGWYEGLQWPGMGRSRVPAFELIPDAKQVHDELLRAQRALRAAS